MKSIITILIFISLHAQAQKSAQWSTSRETYVINYEVQKSVDQQIWSTFTIINPLKKDSNYYVCSLPLTTNYYRIKANMTNGVYYTKIIKLTTIVNAGEDETVLSNNINLSGTFSQN